MNPGLFWLLLIMAALSGHAVPSARFEPQPVAARPVQIQAQASGVASPGQAIPVYIWRLDAAGQRVYQLDGEIPPGRLVKWSACTAGYRQAEYQPDMARPGLWFVRWAKCP